MLRGSCLCGSVRYEVTGPVTPVEFCHCPRCRKSTGAASAPAIAARRSDFRWLEGADRVRVYSAPLRETPPPYRRAFCEACGSPVPLDDPQAAVLELPAGALDDDPGVQPLRHIFAEHAVPWFRFTDGLPRYPRHVPPAERLRRRL